jgi:hypothetical protein
MAGFQLKKGGSTFDFDTLGKVKKDNADFGTWTTDRDNKIVAEDAGGNKVSLDVVWRFNNFNQLCIRDANNRLIFNFHENDSVPFFSVNKAVLQIFPNQENADFNFELRGEWDLNATHDLSFTVNDVGSVIDGFVDDPESRFSYHFFDKAKNPFNIVFSGKWEHFQDAQGVPRLNFVYKRENGSEDTFTLPEAITIDRGVNQFVYEYDKKKRRRRIRLVGLLKITPDFQIIYSIDNQKSEEGNDEVGLTEFKIGAVLTKSKFEGDLEFLLKRPNTETGKTVIGIRGKFTARPGQTAIQVGFAFVQERQGQMVSTTLLFNGKLALKDSLTEVQWKFGISDNVKTLTVTITDVKLGQVTADSKFILKSGNNQREVLFLFGVRF